MARSSEQQMRWKFREPIIITEPPSHPIKQTLGISSDSDPPNSCLNMEKEDSRDTCKKTFESSILLSQESKLKSKSGKSRCCKRKRDFENLIVPSNFSLDRSKLNNISSSKKANDHKERRSNTVAKKVTIKRNNQYSAPYLPDKENISYRKSRAIRGLERPMDFGGKRVDMDRGNI